MRLMSTWTVINLLSIYYFHYYSIRPIYYQISKIIPIIMEKLNIDIAIFHRSNSVFACYDYELIYYYGFVAEWRI